MIRSTPRHFKKQRISRNCSLRLSQLSLPSTEFTSLYLINSEIKSLHVIIIPFILFVNPLKYKNLNFFFVFAILSVVDHSTLPNCVMVALRFLVPSVWVRILVRQPKNSRLIGGSFCYQLIFSRGGRHPSCSSFCLTFPISS